jgi:branched-chain amino acid aminotransferase
MSIINLNGTLNKQDDLGIGSGNAGFRYGYGLFETILVQDGVVQLGRYHWERLYTSMQAIGLQLPPYVTPARLEQQVVATMAANNLAALCRVRLQVYAGDGGYFEPSTQKANYVITCFPLQQEITGINDNGLVLGIADGLAKAPDTLSSMKTSSALLYALAAQQAKSNKWNDALVRNTHGNIIETSICNVFWIKDNTVFTPPLAEGCIAGVMRRYLLERVSGVQQVPLTEQLLLSADEVLVCNAVRRIKWVRQIADTNYGCRKTVAIAREVFG